MSDCGEPYSIKTQTPAHLLHSIMYREKSYWDVLIATPVGMRAERHHCGASTMSTDHPVACTTARREYPENIVTIDIVHPLIYTRTFTQNGTSLALFSINVAYMGSLGSVVRSNLIDGTSYFAVAVHCCGKSGSRTDRSRALPLVGPAPY